MGVGGGGYKGGSGGHKRFRSDGGGHGGGHGGPTPKGEKLDDEGYLYFDAESGACTNFQDRRRKWPFTTSAKGKDHLKALVEANAALRKRNESPLEAVGEPGRVAQPKASGCTSRSRRCAATPTKLGHLYPANQPLGRRPEKKNQTSPGGFEPIDLRIGKKCPIN